MPENLKEVEKDEYINVLEEKVIHLSKLLDICEAQKIHLKKQCSSLREALTKEMSKNNS